MEKIPNGRVRQRGVPRVKDVFPGAPDPGVYLSAVPGRGRSGRPCRAVRLSPGIVVPNSSGSNVPARSPRQDDRLGEVVVVRVAGCRRDLGDAVRVRFGDLPSRPTSCMIPRSWTGAMPAMRRRTRRFTSFARTDTAVPRPSREAADAETTKSHSGPSNHVRMRPDRRFSQEIRGFRIQARPEIASASAP